MHTVESMAAEPNSLADHYTAFRVRERLLLTGHSHQAWPDCAAAAQLEAFQDAAELVDDKWSRAFAKAGLVRQGFSDLLGDQSGLIALAPSTHDLIVRFLSALPLAKRRRIVTTDGEFHSMRRQLDRLGEEGVNLVRVAARPVATLAARLREALSAELDHTAAVMVSSVLFGTSEIVPGLGALASACAKHGVPLLLDAYHHLNVAPMHLDADGLAGVFVVGGGYKYCQLGEGNCFLRFPRDCELRPVVTGWFSEFALLHAAGEAGVVPYGEGPARFAGSTYDPTSHYRAAAVFAFFEQQGLSPELLRSTSQHQIGVLARAFDGLDLDERVICRDKTIALEGIAGFLSLRARDATKLCAALRDRGVLADSRGEHLRLGPAPYLSDSQLTDAVGLLGEAVGEVVLSQAP